MQRIIDMTITYWAKIAEITKDTPYEILIEEDENSSEFMDDFLETSREEQKYSKQGEIDIFLEHKLREFLYRMWLDTKSILVANAYEEKQQDYFKQLYSFSYGVTGYASRIGKGTELQALNILGIKLGYSKVIRRLKSRYNRFQGILQELPEVLQNFLLLDSENDYVAIREAMLDSLPLIEKFYKAIDREKEEGYYAEIRSVCAAKRIKEHVGKQQYPIDGRFVYLTESEYKSYLDISEQIKNLYMSTEIPEAKLEALILKRNEMLQGK